ncbi:MAG: hypothetical protein ACTSUE_18850 [Promethearchaeota archaeon]
MSCHYAVEQYGDHVNLVGTSEYWCESCNNTDYTMFVQTLQGRVCKKCGVLKRNSAAMLPQHTYAKENRLQPGLPGTGSTMVGSVPFKPKTALRPNASLVELDRVNLSAKQRADIQDAQSKVKQVLKEDRWEKKRKQVSDLILVVGKYLKVNQALLEVATKQANEMIDTLCNKALETIYKTRKLTYASTTPEERVDMFLKRNKRIHPVSLAFSSIVYALRSRARISGRGGNIPMKAIATILNENCREEFKTELGVHQLIAFLKKNENYTPENLNNMPADYMEDIIRPFWSELELGDWGSIPNKSEIKVFNKHKSYATFVASTLFEILGCTLMRGKDPIPFVAASLVFGLLRYHQFLAARRQHHLKELEIPDLDQNSKSDVKNVLFQIQNKKFKPVCGCCIYETSDIDSVWSSFDVNNIVRLDASTGLTHVPTTFDRFLVQGVVDHFNCSFKEVEKTCTYILDNWSSMHLEAFQEEYSDREQSRVAFSWLLHFDADLARRERQALQKRKKQNKITFSKKMRLIKSAVKQNKIEFL